MRASLTKNLNMLDRKNKKIKNYCFWDTKNSSVNKYRISLHNRCSSKECSWSPVDSIGNHGYNIYNSSSDLNEEFKDGPNKFMSISAD